MDKKESTLSPEIIDQFNRQVISENNIMRKEKILVLPYNTLRIFDTCVQADIERIKNPNWKGDFDTILKHVLTRTVKDLGKFNNIDSSIPNTLINESWSHYYKISPKTNLYPLLDGLSHQKVISDIIILFPKKDIKEDVYTSAYYDGSIEELEKFINDNAITAIFMDDVDFLMTLIDRGNIEFDWKTVIISKLGYNYMRSKNGTLIMKHSLEFTKKYALEVGCLSLIDF